MRKGDTIACLQLPGFEPGPHALCSTCCRAQLWEGPPPAAAPLLLPSHIPLHPHPLPPFMPAPTPMGAPSACCPWAALSLWGLLPLRTSLPTKPHTPTPPPPPQHVGVGAIGLSLLGQAAPAPAAAAAPPRAAPADEAGPGAAPPAAGAPLRSFPHLRSLRWVAGGAAHCPRSPVPSSPLNMAWLTAQGGACVPVQCLKRPALL